MHAGKQGGRVGQLEAHLANTAAKSMPVHGDSRTIQDERQQQCQEEVGFYVLHVCQAAGVTPPCNACAVTGSHMCKNQGCKHCSKQLQGVETLQHMPGVLSGTARPPCHHCHATV